ncbi:MAG: GrpB family protein [Candidatus Dormibacteria bacterium]
MSNSDGVTAPARTSVPGLPAKPIIDMLLVVDRLALTRRRPPLRTGCSASRRSPPRRRR